MKLKICNLKSGVVCLLCHDKSKEGERIMNKEELLRELDNIVEWGKARDKDGEFKKMRKIAVEIGAKDLLEDFVDYYKLDLIAKEKYKIGGLPAMKMFLYEVNDFCHDVFYIDYFGNARNVSYSNLNVLHHNLRARIKKL